MSKQTECGICPKCESNELEYWNMELNSNCLSYPFTCLECGLKGHEIYNLDFSHMADEKGNHFKKEKPK